MNRKQYSLLTLLMCISSFSIGQPFNCSSHVFVPRSISTDLTYINWGIFYNLHCGAKDKTFTYAGQFIYQNSRKSRGLGAGFLLGTNNTVTIQQAPFAPGTPDVINSVSLGLGTTPPAAPFSELFSIQPERKIFAYQGYFYANLDTWWCGLWADASFAIVNAVHRLNALELGTMSTLCPGILGVCDALNNPSLKFGKFFCGLCNDEKRRTGFDDFQVRLGYNYDWCDSILGVYLIGTVPSGRKPTAEFVFEPLVGSKHGSIGVGFQGFLPIDLCGCPDSCLTLMTDFNWRFVFSHRECRTFDLLPNGPFSRFLPLVTLANPLFTIPGVNLLTQKVRVQPRNTIQWWLGLDYEFCDLNFEFGYNLWWRQKERISTDSITVPANVSIFDLSGAGTFTPLTLANININSAVAGRGLTNKVYGAFSWGGCICDGCFDWMSGLGASYEFVAKHDRCNALSYWAAFGKVAVSF